MNPPVKRGLNTQDSVGAKKKRKRKHRQEQGDHLDMDTSLNTSISLMDAGLLSDYFARMITRSGTNLSSVELGDLSLPAKCFQDTTAWRGTRTLDELPRFLETFVLDTEQLRTVPNANGAPHTLVVTAAAMRAADIARVMKKVSGEGTAVAKLFAKHIKVEAQVKQLQRSHTGVGVGTPARLLQLIEIGALSLDHLERIVVDASHIDQKKMGIMGIKDTMLALAKLLSRADLRMRYGQAKRRVTLLFY